MARIETRPKKVTVSNTVANDPVGFVNEVLQPCAAPVAHAASATIAQYCVGHHHLLIKEIIALQYTP